MSFLCIDCKYYKGHPHDNKGLFSQCTHPTAACKSRVNGRDIYPSCSLERLFTGVCGPEAKNFEPAPPPSPKSNPLKDALLRLMSLLKSGVKG